MIECAGNWCWFFVAEACRNWFVGFAYSAFRFQFLIKKRRLFSWLLLAQPPCLGLFGDGTSSDFCPNLACAWARFEE